MHVILVIHKILVKISIRILCFFPAKVFLSSMCLRQFHHTLFEVAGKYIRFIYFISCQILCFISPKVKVLKNSIRTLNYFFGNCGLVWSWLRILSRKKSFLIHFICLINCTRGYEINFQMVIKVHSFQALVNNEDLISDLHNQIFVIFKLYNLL